MLEKSRLLNMDLGTGYSNTSEGTRQTDNGPEFHIVTYHTFSKFAGIWNTIWNGFITKMSFQYDLLNFRFFFLLGNSTKECKIHAGCN